MPVFGYSSFGGLNGATTMGGNNLCRVTKVTLPEAGNVSKITVYVTMSANPACTQDTAKCIIYDDNAGYPGALRGVTLPSTWLKTQGAHWHDFLFETLLSLPAGDYWIGALAQGYCGMYYLEDANGPVRVGRDATGGSGWYTNPPNPYPNPSYEWDSKALIYGTYTPAGSNVVITPSVLNLIGALLAPIISTQKQITILPDVLGAGGALLAPVLKTGILVAPASFLLEAALHEPLISVKKEALILAEALGITGVLQDPELTININVMPETLALVSFLLAPWIDDPAKKSLITMDAEVYDMNIKAIVED